MFSFVSVFFCSASVFLRFIHVVCILFLFCLCWILFAKFCIFLVYFLVLVENFPEDCIGGRC